MGGGGHEATGRAGVAPQNCTVVSQCKSALAPCKIFLWCLRRLVFSIHFGPSDRWELQGGGGGVACGRAARAHTHTHTHTIEWSPILNPSWTWEYVRCCYCDGNAENTHNCGGFRHPSNGMPKAQNVIRSNGEGRSTQFCHFWKRRNVPCASHVAKIQSNLQICPPPPNYPIRTTADARSSADACLS